ncbi:SCO5389 family protein [Micromonospora sp. WMMD967]|uniref:SCO5389 family protein n=1 Tax=Micromonospora sp. WMMD967 TaxID=3016101 RepID=UPI0024178B0E|nr:SCO5389 family protein [Micromonospora sp. WMMD967]MDG4839601.1 SCO5389 family protein [Micromonospora sp. WMMD967]
MSLTVPPALLDAAERGPVDDEAFIACVRESLPYAWATVSRVVAELESGDAELADNVVPPPSDADRGAARRAAPRRAAPRRAAPRRAAPRRAAPRRAAPRRAAPRRARDPHDIGDIAASDARETATSPTPCGS